MIKKFRQQFGGSLTPELLARYEQSVNWQEGKFQNIEPTELAVRIWDVPGMLYKQLTNRIARVPAPSLPVVPFDREGLLADDSDFKFIWYGHSAVLMRLLGQTVLIDPMLGSNASPIAPVVTRRFSEGVVDLIDEWPPIDLILISHDHYDHLDYDSIQLLKHKTRRFFVALGVKRHLVAWGIAPEYITEFDWWDEQPLGQLRITYTPTRHFSGRGLTDRAKSLWGGWAFRLPDYNVWFSGDGGYGPHFGDIGKRLGPFDFAFMECGQYNELWRPIHLFPDESVQAAIDAKVQLATPVHWAGFALAFHPWREPVEQFAAAAAQQRLATVYPRIGALTDPRIATAADHWWE